MVCSWRSLLKHFPVVLVFSIWKLYSNAYPYTNYSNMFPRVKLIIESIFNGRLHIDLQVQPQKFTAASYVANRDCYVCLKLSVHGAIVRLCEWRCVLGFTGECVVDTYVHTITFLLICGFLHYLASDVLHHFYLKWLCAHGYFLNLCRRLFSQHNAIIELLSTYMQP